MPLPRPAPGTGRWWVIGIVGCVLAVVGIVWYGIAATHGAIRADVTAYAVVSDSQVKVEYDVHRPTGTAVTCVITALDERHGRVGTLTDHIPAADQTSTHRGVTVRTGARAVTGVVDSCVADR
jgi:hypothetical protein